MLFDRQAVIDHIRQQVGPDQAQQAAQSLPDQVDTEQHGDMLQQFGVDPKNMASQLGGQLGSRFGDTGPQMGSEIGSQVGQEVDQQLGFGGGDPNQGRQGQGQE
jgi:hypothetical protein